MTNLHANKGRLVQSHFSLKTTILNIPASTRCRLAHNAQSWFGFAFSTLLLLCPCVLHGQVPGICTQPDGFSWPMSNAPNAAVSNSARLPIGVQRNGQNQIPIDTAALKTFLNRTDINGTSAKQPVVNRYSPHSVHNTNPPRQPTQPLNLGHTVSSVSNRTAISGDDDLLAPTRKNDGDDLLAPPAVPSSNAPSDPLSHMGPDVAREQQRSESKIPAPANGQAAIDQIGRASCRERV